LEVVSAKSSVLETVGSKGKKAAFQNVPDPVRTLDEIPKGGPKAKTTSLRSELERLTNKAAAQVDEAGAAAYSPKQVRAILRNPEKLFALFRGSRIDALVRQAVQALPVLRDRLFGKPNKGVDFTDRITRETFDMTTASEAASKAVKYGDSVQVIRTDVRRSR
jgi:hypothetical protein